VCVCVCVCALFNRIFFLVLATHALSVD